MRVLEQVAREDQKARWLQPIIDGEVQSAFVMTEPDGCGSDPSLTYTRAERRGNDRWVVHGRKHFITGAAEAKHFILMARTSDDDRKGLTAFLFHADSPAGASSAASRSWGRRSTAGIASWSSTGWRSPTRTG